MISAPFPIDEPRRLEVLRDLQLLDTEPDPVLDGLVRSAAAIARCPVSLISLVDSDRQWFKARIGLEARQTPRDVAFCAHAILDDAVFEVPDATVDPRFADNPLVTSDPSVRFYAGAPINVAGQNIGTLCVIDRVPHALDDLQRALLSDLGKAVEHWIEGRLQRRALEAAERYSRDLFDNLDDAVVLLDARRAILDANPAAVELLGHQRGTLLQLGLPDIVDEQERVWLREHAGSDPFVRHPLTWTCVTRLGRRFPAELRSRRFDERRTLLSIRDVQERNARSEQLRQLFLAVEQSTESIVCTDLSGRILYANPTTCAMSGYDAAELIGENAKLLGSGLTPHETFVDLYAHLERGQIWNGLLFNRRKDGAEYLQAATISPLRSTDGSVTQYVAVMKDVTEERRMQAELAEHREHLEDLVARRTAELAHAMRAAEAANEAKSGFLATMSHEIRTPMNGVVGILDILRRSTLTPHQLDLVETMNESAFALLGIIDDILDFSKIEAGRLTLEHEDVDLSALVESVCFSLKPIARERDVRLHVFVDPALPDLVSTDPVRVRQILNNLIGNAIKFSAGSERQGRVSVRAEVQDDSRFRLTVADNGVGIADEAQARIFKPFEQAEGSTMRRFGGTGLGLSICNRLSALLGGSIAVESEPGIGSIFRVVLPMTPSTGPAPARTRHRLDGVHCKIVSSDGEAGGDWAVYLRDSGAVVENLSSLEALRASLNANPVFICVVLIDARQDAMLLNDLDALLASFRMLLVVVSHGQNREPRSVDSGSVHLESRLVFRESLLKAVAMAVGFEPARSDVAAASSVQLPTAPPPTGPDETRSPEDATEDVRLILVAEDNPINQKVIRTQLELLGYAVEITDDGEQALLAWRTGRHGLLLTDLHMPVMDGYALAQAIRDEERAPSHLPIIALTANTLHGEAGRCRSAGMDDYMTKPVQLDELGRVLSQWLPRTEANPAAPVGSTGDPTAATGLSVLDPRILGDLIGDDPAVIDEFLDEFRTALRQAGAELRRAVVNGQHGEVREIAHRLKSSALSVGALALGACCERIEDDFGVGADMAAPASLDSFDAVVAATDEALTGRAAQPGEASGRPSDAAPQARETPVGVLILDDQSDDAERLAAQLRSIGIEPLMQFQQGRPALEWLRQRDTSSLLLLLDLHMPGMDGIDFMRRLAEQSYDGALAIVSSADSRVLQTAAKLGSAQKLEVLGHFGKPFGGRKLQALIDEWHDYVPVAARNAIRKYTANEILHGIVNDEMLLHYQPKVSLVDGSVKGLEALVRWKHPVDGMVPPGSFIGVMETQGGIDMLTGSVMALALRQARAWNDAGQSRCIAINVSMLNLLRLDFPELLLAEAARHGVSATDLRLEVTESHLMSDLRSQIGSLTRLKLKGIGLSIDDFGTGHSSLVQLRDIPFDELKIDQSFVHGSAHDATQRAIFAASLSMAHDLGMQAVAEGVEDRADWDFVRASGVDMAQGYFIARPMPAEDLPGWIAQWDRRIPELL